MKLIATLIIATLAMTLSKTDNNIATSNDCSAKLTVEKDRSSKSADEDGAQFVLILTNTSRSTKTFKLSSKNLSEPCGNNTQYNRTSSSGNNTLNALDVSFQNNNSNSSLLRMSSNEGIVLNSGESYKFIVSAIAPKGTPYNTWSCIEIEATSVDCKSVADSKTLSVYVVDPTEG